MGNPVATAKRIVVKVGSSLVTDEGRGLDHAAVARWAEEIANLKRAGREIVLVSSGAIAEGVKRLGWRRRPAAMHELQAAAAVGQMGLVQAYESAFTKFGLHTADPRRDPTATLVRSARAGDPKLEAIAGGVGTAIGRGGMLTKVLAAKRAARSGASTVIVCGRDERVLSRLAGGELIGTLLCADTI